MCLAIPGKVLEIHEDAGVRMGRTDFAGVIKQVCLAYTPEVNLGDYVLVHVGFALGKVDETEAHRAYEILEAMNQLAELEVETEPSPAAPPRSGLQAASGKSVVDDPEPSTPQNLQPGAIP